MIGHYDAAVIDKEDGKPHVVKRMDRPHIRVIPEWFGGGALPRKELHEAAEQLTASQAGLIAVGEPTIEKGLDKALTKGRQGGEADRGGHDRRNHQRAAGSTQELTLPPQPKALRTAVLRSAPLKMNPTRACLRRVLLT
jgi:hypothetical protein